MITIDTPEKIKSLSVPGSILHVIIPDKWLLLVTPDEVCFDDMFISELNLFPLTTVKQFMMGNFDHHVKELAKSVYYRRGGK